MMSHISVTVSAWKYPTPLALIRTHTEWRARISYFIQNKILTVGIKWREFFLFSNKIRIRLCPHWLCVCLLKTFPVIIITAGREENTGTKEKHSENIIWDPLVQQHLWRRKTRTGPSLAICWGNVGLLGRYNKGAELLGECVCVRWQLGGWLARDHRPNELLHTNTRAGLVRVCVVSTL